MAEQWENVGKKNLWILTLCLCSSSLASAFSHSEKGEIHRCASDKDWRMWSEKVDTKLKDPSIPGLSRSDFSRWLLWPKCFILTFLHPDYWSDLTSELFLFLQPCQQTTSAWAVEAEPIVPFTCISWCVCWMLDLLFSGLLETVKPWNLPENVCENRSYTVIQ